LATSSESELVHQFFANGRGYFVEVGANQPQIASQTWHLEQHGWSGVLIEPLPHLAEQLRRARRARVFAVACSSPDKAGRELPFFVAGAGSSLERKGMRPGTRPSTTINVPVMSLDQVLQQAGAPKPIDFLSIDVEGHEIEALRGLDFNLWRPRLILMEDHVGNLSKHRFMKSRGYKLVRRTDLNGWYVPAESPVDFGWGERWRLLRKYRLALPIRVLRNFSRRLRQPLKDWLAARKQR
jgi:FkbM family methyltransferase